MVAAIGERVRNGFVLVQLRDVRRRVEAGEIAAGRTSWTEFRRRSVLLFEMRRRRPGSWLRLGAVVVACALGVVIGWAVGAPAGAGAGAAAAAAFGAAAWLRTGAQVEDPECGAWLDRALGCWQSAEVLSALERTIGARVLHDRAIPGGSVVDHVVVAPCGIWVVASQRAHGRAVERTDGWHVVGHRGTEVERLRTAVTRRCAEDLSELVAEGLRPYGDVPVRAALATWGVALPSAMLVDDGCLVVPGRVLPATIAAMKRLPCASDLGAVAEVVERLVPDALMLAASRAALDGSLDEGQQAATPSDRR